VQVFKTMRSEMNKDSSVNGGMSELSQITPVIRKKVA